MKCKCKNKMQEIASYVEDLHTSYSPRSVFWCNKCGRAVHVFKYDYQKDILTWHEPEEIIKAEKEYWMCEYKKCKKMAKWETYTTNSDLSTLRCDQHTGKGFTLSKKTKINWIEPDKRN